MNNTMTINDIINYLPHRYPFLLIDRILEVEPRKFILAQKNVTMNEPFFMGHFPAKPVMPGVLILEALAQAAAILAYRSTDWEPDKTLFYLAAIDNTRFKKMVIPGDQLLLKIEVSRTRSNAWKFRGVATVDNEIVCTTEMTSTEGKIS